MNKRPDKTGRFAYMPFYDREELDSLCEHAMTSHLTTSTGSVSFPIPTDRLITLIERDAPDLDMYADLSGEGENVQGLTVFTPRCKPAVSIDQSLSNVRSEHRLRTTLAHEYGHVILHDHPFQEKAAVGSLFDEQNTDTAKCKRDSIMQAHLSDWMEWQAGYVCGSLLMPKSYFLQAAYRYCEKYRCLDRMIEGTNYPLEVAQGISREFQVSDAAALVRIRQLGLVKPRVTNLPLF